MYHRLINYLSSGIIVLFILFIPESCTVSNDNHLLKEGQTGGLLKDIKSRGTLVALTDDNSLNYFTYEGERYGFQYDLLKKFADHLGVNLEIIVEPNVYKALQYLQQQRVDIIAMELPKINDDNFKLQYTTPLYTDYQVLVQAKPKDWVKNTNSFQDKLISQIEQLKHKSITVSANKQLQYYLSDIQHVTNNQVDIVAVNYSSVNEVIENVAKGETEYCIAYESTAKAAMLTHSNLDAHTRVSPEIYISWVVRDGAVNLLEVVNSWISTSKETNQIDKIKAKYFNNPRWVNIALGKPVNKRSISDYDQIIKEMSSKIGWDWRLIAALIYHESKFNAEVTSRRGAFGLMQLMPATASTLGVHRESTVNEQIAAGIRLLNNLDKRLSTLVPDKTERRKFVLASYNIGLAHILDAMNLAEKYGKDPSIWSDNVEVFLLAKSKPEFYNDTIVKYGKISGKETHRFVLDVLDQYEHYKTLAMR